MCLWRPGCLTLWNTSTSLLSHELPSNAIAPKERWLDCRTMQHHCMCLGELNTTDLLYHSQQALKCRSVIRKDKFLGFPADNYHLFSIQKRTLNSIKCMCCETLFLKNNLQNISKSQVCFSIWEFKVSLLDSLDSSTCGSAILLLILYTFRILYLLRNL